MSSNIIKSTKTTNCELPASARVLISLSVIALTVIPVTAGVMLAAWSLDKGYQLLAIFMSCLSAMSVVVCTYSVRDLVSYVREETYNGETEEEESE